MTTKPSDIELGLLEALSDMKAGKAAKVHTAEDLAKRRRGRPPLPMVKVPVKIRLDADLLTTLRQSGSGWQTRINETLRNKFMSPRATSIKNFFFDQEAPELSVHDLLLKTSSSTTMMAPYIETRQPQEAYLA